MADFLHTFSPSNIPQLASLPTCSYLLTIICWLHRSVLVNETYHRRGPGCICGDGHRCHCCGNTGPSPSMACTMITSRNHASQALLLHHYVSQSKEHMRRKTATGEADLARRNRSATYWNRVEALSNSLVDSSTPLSLTGPSAARRRTYVMHTVRS